MDLAGGGGGGGGRGRLEAMVIQQMVAKYFNISTPNKTIGAY